MLPFKFKKIKTIGDGSCFLHAILQAFSKQYIKGNNNERREIVRKLRKNISSYLDETNIYNELSRGQLKEICKFVPLMKKENMKKYMDSSSWLTYHFVELVSTIFDINIYIITNNNNIYNLGDKEIYYKERNSVFINYLEDHHFETLGIETPDGIKTFFSPKSDIFKKTNLLIGGK